MIYVHNKRYYIFNKRCVGELTPVDYMMHMTITKNTLRSHAETWCGVKTDAEFQIWIYKGSWQKVFRQMRSMIPNDFKSKA